MLTHLKMNFTLYRSGIHVRTKSIKFHTFFATKVTIIINICMSVRKQNSPSYYPLIPLHIGLVQGAKLNSCCTGSTRQSFFRVKLDLKCNIEEKDKTREIKR